MDIDQRQHAVQHQHLRQFMVFVYKQNIVDGILPRFFPKTISLLFKLPEQMSKAQCRNMDATGPVQ